MYFENSQGKVFLTNDAIIVECGLCIKKITPKKNIPKEQFLRFEYRNQVRELEDLELIDSLFENHLLSDM